MELTISDNKDIYLSQTITSKLSGHFSTFNLFIFFLSIFVFEESIWICYFEWILIVFPESIFSPQEGYYIYFCWYCRYLCISTELTTSIKRKNWYDCCEDIVNIRIIHVTIKYVFPISIDRLFLWANIYFQYNFPFLLCCGVTR